MGKVSKALDKATQTDSAPTIEVQNDKDIQEKEQSQPPQAEVVRPASTVSKSSVPPPSGPWDERLRLATTITGPVAENFRTLRNRILHPGTKKVPKSLLVTSATPGEGKSFVCANLGIALAQGVDHYSLMVDCDLRKPTMHKLFGLSIERGLVNYLRDGDELSELIIPAGIDTLSVLPAGPPPVNPSELLGSGSMARLLNELENRYDDRIIMLDSPPLQAASETAILAQHVDGVVLVVRWGGGRREHVEKLVNLIGRDRIVGVVFNAYKENVLDAKIFGYYEYQDKYTYGEKK